MTLYSRALLPSRCCCHSLCPLLTALTSILLVSVAAGPCPLSDSQASSAKEQLQINNDSQFVSVCATEFIKGGRVLRIIGWNTYRLVDAEIDDCGEESFMSDPAARHCFNAGLQSTMMLMQLNAVHKVPITRMERQFDQASAMGMNTIRIYDEVAFRALDRVLAEARFYDMNVILCFANNWDGAGSIEEYLAWGDFKSLTKDEGHLLFFTDSNMRHMMKNHIRSIIMRRNTVTGELYRDDATIMAWNLINEPRCKTTPSSIGQSALQEWIADMASFVKDLDTNHLLTIGEEGFFQEGSAWSADNPSRWSSQSGQDFLLNHYIPQIDFATFHIWPSHWKAEEWFLINWIAAHIEVSELMQKPVLIEEFGVEILERTRNADLKQREDVFKEVYNAVEVYTAAGKPIAGTLFWMLEIERPGEADTYGIMPTDESIFELIRQHAKQLHAMH